MVSWIMPSNRVMLRELYKLIASGIMHDTLESCDFVMLCSILSFVNDFVHTLKSGFCIHFALLGHRHLLFMQIV